MSRGVNWLRDWERFSGNKEAQSFELHLKYYTCYTPKSRGREIEVYFCANRTHLFYLQRLLLSLTTLCMVNLKAFIGDQYISSYGYGHITVGNLVKEGGDLSYRSTSRIMGFKHPTQIYRNFRQRASSEDIILNFLEKFYYSYEGGQLISGTPHTDTLFTLGIVVRTDWLNIDFSPENLRGEVCEGEAFFHHGIYEKTDKDVVIFRGEALAKSWAGGELGEDTVLTRIKTEMYSKVLRHLGKASTRSRVFSHTCLSLGNSLQSTEQRQEMARILCVGVYLTLIKEGELRTNTLSYTLTSLFFDRYPGMRGPSLSFSFIYSTSLLATITILCLKKSKVLTEVHRAYARRLFLHPISQDKILMSNLGHTPRSFGNNYSIYVFTFQLDNLLAGGSTSKNSMVIETINNSVWRNTYFPNPVKSKLRFSDLIGRTPVYLNVE
jgi:hypothetical protein